MFYLADFKRRYEEWLYEKDNQNKKVTVSQLNTINKRRKVSEVKTVIENARQNNLKKGRNKRTKTYRDAQKRLRKYTGGFREEIPLTEQQQKLANRIKANKQRRWNDQVKEVTEDLWESPSKERLPKTEINQPKTVTTKRLKPSELPVIKMEEKRGAKTQIKNPVKSEPNHKTVTTKKVAKKVGRKVLKGLGIGALGVGALYGLNRLRKTRKDKGKKRGRYK